MEQRRLILIIALGFVLILLWQAWLGENRSEMDSSASGATSSQVADDLPTGDGPDESVDRPSGAGVPGGSDDMPGAASDDKRITVETDVLSLAIDPVGGTLVQADLLEYPVTLDQPDHPVRLLEDSQGFTYIAQSGLLGRNDAPAPDHHAQFEIQESAYQLVDGESVLEVPLVWERDGVRVTKTFIFKRGSYAIDVRHTVENTTDAEWRGQQYRQLTRSGSTPGMQLMYTYTGGVYAGTPAGGGDRLNYEKIDFEEMGKIRLDKNLEDGWAGIIQHYFMSAWVPADSQQVNQYYTLKSDRDGFPVYSMGLLSPTATVGPGSTETLESILYVGPKIQSNLEPLATGMHLAVDFGILTFISEPIFWLLDLFHDWVGNWGWAIVMVTLVIKLIFLWPSAVSYRSMARMRAVTPKMQALKERFSDDKQRLSQEMMKLYQKEKINPLGGCLPILIQIPVFIALYWVLVESVELRQAPWILWIDDLTQRDPYFILPLLMGLSMWAQQRLNPAPVDPMQKKIFQWLPVVFTVFFAFFPAGLVLYWFVNNLLSIIQQAIITRRVERQMAAKKGSS
ncbi:membrane protein insertase YidC [Guyparkeria sp.]|uniref:membrane protein insertase YidC n=1 Tax=Guyparkeria sp. TaxID=2035736 RepID=UPI003970DA34